MATLKKGSRGPEVKALQQKLNLMADGIYGPLTEEAVKEFQKSHGLTVDGIAGPKTLAALGGLQTAGRKISKIILHCTATPEGEDYNVEQIRDIHVNGNGWSDIGYHWLIGRDGTIYPGRPEAIAGAHCEGYNTDSIGVSYVGGCPARSVKNWMNQSKDTRTDAQKKALVALVKELRSRYPGATVHGHNEFSNKACPSFDVKKEFKNI